MISSPSGCVEFVDTELLTTMTYIPQVLASFHCELKSTRLMRLAPKSQIREHRDHDLDIANGVARIHIPIETNNDVRFVLNDESVTLNAGDCWYLRLADLHSVDNAGESDRIHLVIDVIANDWLREQLTAGLTSNTR